MNFHDSLPCLPTYGILWLVYRTTRLQATRTGESASSRAGAGLPKWLVGESGLR